MGSLFGQDWFVIPAFGGAVFLISYLWANRVLNWLYSRSLGQRAEVVQLLEQMFVEVNQRQLTMAMLLSSFGLGFLLFVALWPHLIIGAIMGSVVTVLGWSIPKLVVKNIYEKRCTKFVNQMVDGMTVMANGIRAGLSVNQSMERIVENMNNPMKQEFNLVLSQMRLGRSMEDALNELGTRIARPDVQMFVTSVNILQETGGNMSETFQTIVYTIRERQKIEKKIEALTAQGLAQGVIITCVPFVLLIIFWLVQPSYIKPLFTTAAGLVAFFIMLALQVMGGVMVRKIAKINV
jgi:tight adherence protein B